MRQSEFTLDLSSSKVHTLNYCTSNKLKDGLPSTTTMCKYIEMFANLSVRKCWISQTMNSLQPLSLKCQYSGYDITEWFQIYEG